MPQRHSHNVRSADVKGTYQTYYFVPPCVLVGPKGSLPQIHHQPPSVAARTALPSGLTHIIIRHQSPPSRLTSPNLACRPAATLHSSPPPAPGLRPIYTMGRTLPNAIPCILPPC